MRCVTFPCEQTQSIAFVWFWPNTRPNNPTQMSSSKWVRQYVKQPDRPTTVGSSLFKYCAATLKFFGVLIIRFIECNGLYRATCVKNYFVLFPNETNDNLAFAIHFPAKSTFGVFHCRFFFVVVIYRYSFPTLFWSVSATHPDLFNYFVLLALLSIDKYTYVRMLFFLLLFCLNWRR